MMTKEYSVSDWFNIRNPEHLIALKHYLVNTQWPKHFVPADVTFEEDWFIKLLRKVTEIWIEEHTTATRSASIGPPDDRYDFNANQKKRDVAKLKKKMPELN